jgi:hypothetical protein
VGTLVDFKANPLDVTATIVDLAVRGHLTIEDAEHEEQRRVHDWTLTRKAPNEHAVAALLPYEKLLLDSLFRDGDTVQISELRNEFASRMREVQESLQTDAEERGWFAKRSGLLRFGFGCLGVIVVIVGVAIAVGLAIWTHAALVAIPVIIAGIVLLVGTRYVPRRTAKGLRHPAARRRLPALHRRVGEGTRALRGAQEPVLGVPAVRHRVRCDGEVGEGLRRPRRRAARHVVVVPAQWPVQRDALSPARSTASP